VCLRDVFEGKPLVVKLEFARRFKFCSLNAHCDPIFMDMKVAPFRSLECFEMKVER
jgi:hypothetical protein